MKKIFFFLLLFSKSSFGQYFNHDIAFPTYSDRFINEQTIDWAAWYIDTVHFGKINLSDILRKEFKANKIKVCMPDEIVAFNPARIHYASKCEIKWGTHCTAKFPLIDSLGNIVKRTKERQREEDEDEPERNFSDSSVYNLLKVAQVLYIENKKLKVYIPFVYTRRCIITSGGINLGAADHFVTAFNFDRKYTKSPGDKIIFIQQTNKRIKVDSIGNGYGTYNLKQLYSRNIAATLWSLAYSGKLTALSLETNKQISLKELDKYLNISEMMETPFADSSYSMEPFYMQAIQPSIFREIQITQDWYYNQTKNIVFCNIPEVILYANRLKNKEYEKELSPILKIVFNN